MPYRTNSHCDGCVDIGRCPDCGSTSLREDHQSAELVCTGCGLVRETGLQTLEYNDYGCYALLPEEDENGVWRDVRSRLRGMDMPDDHLRTVCDTTARVRDSLSIREWNLSIFAAVMWCSKQGLIAAVPEATVSDALGMKFCDVQRARRCLNRLRWQTQQQGDPAQPSTLAAESSMPAPAPPCGSVDAEPPAAAQPPRGYRKPLRASGMSRQSTCVRTFTTFSSKLPLTMDEIRALNMAATKLLHGLPGSIVHNQKAHILGAATCESLCRRMFPQCASKHVCMAFGVSSIGIKKLVAELADFSTAPLPTAPQSA